MNEIETVAKKWMEVIHLVETSRVDYFYPFCLRSFLNVKEIIMREYKKKAMKNRNFLCTVLLGILRKERWHGYI